MERSKSLELHLTEGIRDAHQPPFDANSSSSAFASFRSRVSNPSVNHPFVRQPATLSNNVSNAIRAYNGRLAELEFKLRAASRRSLSQSDYGSVMSFGGYVAPIDKVDGANVAFMAQAICLSVSTDHVMSIV
jgi:hypothetical protein